KPADGFDAMAPENISPLVVWLGSAESADVTGRVFEVDGGRVSIADGWRHGRVIDKGAHWEPKELGPVVRDLLASAIPPDPVYGA
ncbi:MAG: short-chain dehydrogenase, partial [Dehalococcoidia bacterium]